MNEKINLDPKDREWEYDGNGAKIYKYDPRFPVKRPYKETDLDGGVPFKKDWVKESNEVTSKL